MPLLSIPKALKAKNLISKGESDPLYPKWYLQENASILIGAD